MTRQIRNIPSDERARATLDAVRAVVESGTRYGYVTFDNGFHGIRTTRYELVGVGLNATHVGSPYALVVRPIEAAGTYLVDFIPLTRLISVTRDKP